ncbi:digestive cysteine proteinase 1-like [Tubulanus polymorphus]|uniref:digestive cysteine proteinase 1-like n=1 Tax=Tubulanus polymorphus TaxID=672921 RepID=UPI003DA33106
MIDKMANLMPTGLKMGLQIILLIALSGFAYGQSKPDFGDYYQVVGTLQLPYAELVEPFIAFYDAKAGKSRIDYYNGMVKTFQRSDVGTYGKSYKIAPMSTYKVMNQLTCFLSEGDASSRITPQSVLPDMSSLSFVKKEVVAGVPCLVYANVTVIGLKKNSYTLWVNAQTGAPVRYEMMGFDNLLGSHYDKYYVNYFNFDKLDRPNPAVFEVPNNGSCGGFPGPGAEHRVLMNPMQEYIHNYDGHIHHMFENFKMTHKRRYNNTVEHASRKHYFRQNVRFIHSKNRANLGYTLAVNHLADKSDDEMKMIRGLKHTPGIYNGGKPFHLENYDLNKVPDQMDWRLYGAVTPVKDQAVCGSCWSFGTAATIEGAYFLKTGHLVRLSQQMLMDCSWGEGNNACDGGEDFRSYQYIMKNGGLASEESYGPYLAQDSFCHSKTVPVTAKITGYVNVTSFDLTALKVAIANHGPISVGIDASHKSLSFYANGVYYEPKCGNKPDQLDHAVLAVGYGEMNGEKYWLIKNSWSTYWGNDGYVLMSQKNNNCGVATAATYVEM